MASRMTIMRDARSNNAAFRAALADLGAMLVYEASADLQLETFDVQTPVAVADGYRLQKPPIIVPVIRAGLGTSRLLVVRKLVHYAHPWFLGLLAQQPA